MANDKPRRKILFESARMMLSRQETDCYRARLKAARKLYKGWVKPHDLPSEREIRSEVQRMLNFHQPMADDRFERFLALLKPLAQVAQRKSTHPEGDALYHSLQVFELARDEIPYDEEFLLAALLHDVGKGIDPLNPVESALGALAGTISPRTEWLIAHCPEAGKIAAGTIGVRARRRLHESDDFREVVLLAECDRQGRQPGAIVEEVEDALAWIRDLNSEYEETYLNEEEETDV